MDKIKELIAQYGRPLLSKYITRLVLWGSTAISAKVAAAAPSSDTQAQVVDWLVTLALAGVAAGVDYLHHKADNKPAAQQ